MAAEGSADPNALLAFKRLYLEPVKDNVDGAFQAPVTESYKEIFERNPRFELVGESAAADTVVRTAVTKKAQAIDVDITLLLAATGEVFTAEHDSVPTTATGKETGTKVKQLLKAALKRIPFYGTVTGRDGQELTFDIGASQGLRRGDTIQISRVDNIKRHPLLKSIVDVQLVPVGNAVIDTAEDTIAFGHVKSEITAEKIQKLQKVTAIEARAAEAEPEKPKSIEPEMRMTDETAGRRSVEPSAGPAADNPDRPHLGYVGLGIQVSSFSSSNQQAGSTALSGGGFSPGARIQGELWLTKNWFADLMIGVATVSYANDLPAGASGSSSGPSYSTTTHSFGISAGYKYLPDGNLYGPQIAAKIGYLNWGWSTPVSTTDLLSSKSYSGINLGLGGQLPITSYEWGMVLNINVLLFGGISEDKALQLLGDKGSATGATFFLGGYHYFTPKVAVRFGPLIETFSANDNTGDSTSQKTFGVLGSVLYYF